MTKRKTTTATAPPDWYLDLWPEIDALLGPNAFSVLRLVLPAEKEVGDWLASRGRRPSEPLRPDDLPAVIRETEASMMAPRFAAALWALRMSAEPSGPPARVSPSGELLIDSDAPLARRLPDIVKVRRVASPARRVATQLLGEVAKALANTERAVEVSPDLRRLAVLQTVAALKDPWRTRPKSRPATNAEVASALGVSKDALRQVTKRERRKAAERGDAGAGESKRPK